MNVIRESSILDGILHTTTKKVTIHTIHDWSYDLETTVRANSCSREQFSREQLFANGSSYLDTALAAVAQILIST